MKVAFILNDITGLGGVERVVTNTANAFEEDLGHSVDIISVFPQKNKRAYIKINKKIKIFYLSKATSSNVKLVKYLKLNEKLRRLIADNRYDIVISNSVSLTLMILFIRLFSNSYKIIAWEHSQYDNASKHMKFLRKVFYRYLDLVVCLSHHDENIFKHLNNKATTIYNFIDDKHKENSKLETEKIIAVGRLETEKGFDLLIKAFVKVNQKHPIWKLDIYGEGSQRDVLQKLIIENHLDGVIKLKGFVEDIDSIFPSYSIFVLSSRSESFGMVLLEAMSHGLACVSYNCKIGPTEIIDDKVDGLLAEAENIDDLSDKIETLIENNELRKYIANNAIVKSKKFSKHNIISQWDKTLKTIKKD
jgi:glycosyltransferase involved in cell wall biosynthesis